MATGSEISAVFCAAALMTLSSAVLPVDARCGGAGVRQPVQRDVVQHVVFRRRLLGIGAVRPVREARMPKQPRREAGRGVRHAVADGLRPRASSSRRRPCSPSWRTQSSASNTARSFSDSPAGAGPPTASTAATSGGTVAGRLTWMPSNPCRRLPRHRVGNRGAPVAALGDVARVPEALHQLRPGLRDAVGSPAGAGRLAGEAVARHGRDDDVESVLGAAAMRGWIRERADDLELLDDRAGPAMRDDQRKRILDDGNGRG